MAPACTTRFGLRWQSGAATPLSGGRGARCNSTRVARTKAAWRSAGGRLQKPAAVPGARFVSNRSAPPAKPRSNHSTGTCIATRCELGQLALRPSHDCLTRLLLSTRLAGADAQSRLQAGAPGRDLRVASAYEWLWRIRLASVRCHAEGFGVPASAGPRRRTA